MATKPNDPNDLESMMAFMYGLIVSIVIIMFVVSGVLFYVFTKNPQLTTP